MGNPLRAFWRVRGTFGPYDVLDVLNRGGMGNVYRVSKTVGESRGCGTYALKVIRKELASDHFLKRFERERHTLAALDHPNVVRILDQGQTEQGIPYFVMELVDGEPITDYCFAERLPLRPRLRLMATICEAVDYLHRQDRVHRDLKPANVFVTESGTPKLLDFGLAKKYSDPSKSSLMGLTGYTPSFASPEQILGSTTSLSSDIYSLGVILYLLLTGRLPVHITPEMTRAEQVDAIMNCQAIPPSQVSTADGFDPCFPEEPTRLQQDLAMLDESVLRAIRFHPRERYASAAELASSLHAFLGHE